MKDQWPLRTKCTDGTRIDTLTWRHFTDEHRQWNGLILLTTLTNSFIAPRSRRIGEASSERPLPSVSTPALGSTMGVEVSTNDQLDDHVPFAHLSFLSWTRKMFLRAKVTWLKEVETTDYRPESLDQLLEIRKRRSAYEQFIVREWTAISPAEWPKGSDLFQWLYFQQIETAIGIDLPPDSSTSWYWSERSVV